MRDDLGVAGVGRLTAEDDGRPLRPAQDFVEQRQLQLPVALPTEFGAEVCGPQAFCAHLFLEWVDDAAPGLVERGVLQVRPDEVERLDFVAHEGVGPVEEFLELRIGFEIPSHAASFRSTPPRQEHPFVVCNAPARVWEWLAGLSDGEGIGVAQIVLRDVGGLGRGVDAQRVGQRRRPVTPPVGQLQSRTQRRQVRQRQRRVDRLAP